MSEENLDPEQLAAVKAPERAIAVLAGPGSGKTRTLSFRTRYLLSNDAQACALLLTFTNKAAAEMKARSLGVSGLPSRRLQASTFHTFCADVLRSHGELVNVPKEFEILDREESEELAGTIVAATAVKRYLRDWSAARLRQHAISRDLNIFGSAYQEAKKIAGVVDFDDLVVRVAELFARHQNVTRAYSAKFRHILVDEFQDTNAVQFSIVDSLAAHAATISIFADDDQAIFGFAGAEAINIRRFITKLQAKVYPLTVNYRSGEHIVEIANKLIAADPSASGRRMQAHWEGGEVRTMNHFTVEQEANVIAAEISAAVSAGVPTSDFAILVRSGYRANHVFQQLQARGLPVSDWRGDTHAPPERRIFASCLAVTRGSLSARQVQRLCALMDVPATEEEGTDAFLRRHESQALARGLSRVRQLAFEGASPHTIARAVQVAVAEQDAEMGESIESIVAAIASFEFYDKDFTLEHLLAELALGSIGRAPTEGGGIKLASLHRTKGLQWKVVYLVGLEQGHLPDFRTTDLSEERRLSFVGVSRAEETLIVTYSQSDGRYSKDPSPFLAEMGLTI